MILQTGSDRLRRVDIETPKDFQFLQIGDAFFADLIKQAKTVEGVFHFGGHAFVNGEMDKDRNLMLKLNGLPVLYHVMAPQGFHPNFERIGEYWSNPKFDFHNPLLRFERVLSNEINYRDAIRRLSEVYPGVKFS